MCAPRFYINEMYVLLTEWIYSGVIVKMKTDSPLP